MKRTQDEESFIYESCYYCKKSFRKISQIYIECELDNYVCKKCIDKHDLNEIIKLSDVEVK